MNNSFSSFSVTLTLFAINRWWYAFNNSCTLILSSSLRPMGSSSYPLFRASRISNSSAIILLSTLLRARPLSADPVFLLKSLYLSVKFCSSMILSSITASVPEPVLPFFFSQFEKQRHKITARRIK